MVPQREQADSAACQEHIVSENRTETHQINEVELVVAIWRKCVNNELIFGLAS